MAAGTSRRNRLEVKLVSVEDLARPKVQLLDYASGGLTKLDRLTTKVGGTVSTLVEGRKSLADPTFRDRALSKKSFGDGAMFVAGAVRRTLSPHPARMDIEQMYSLAHAAVQRKVYAQVGLRGKTLETKIHHMEPVPGTLELDEHLTFDLAFTSLRTDDVLTLEFREKLSGMIREESLVGECQLQLSARRGSKRCQLLSSGAPAGVAVLRWKFRDGSKATDAERRLVPHKADPLSIWACFMCFRGTNRTYGETANFSPLVDAADAAEENADAAERPAGFAKSETSKTAGVGTSSAPLMSYMRLGDARRRQGTTKSSVLDGHSASSHRLDEHRKVRIRSLSEDDGKPHRRSNAQLDKETRAHSQQPTASCNCAEPLDLDKVLPPRSSTSAGTPSGSGSALSTLGAALAGSPKRGDRGTRREGSRREGSRRWPASRSASPEQSPERAAREGVPPSPSGSKGGLLAAWMQKRA